MSGCVQQEPDVAVRCSSVQLKRAEWGLSGSVCGSECACVCENRGSKEIPCVSWCFFLHYWMQGIYKLNYMCATTCVSVNYSSEQLMNGVRDRGQQSSGGRILIESLPLTHGALWSHLSLLVCSHPVIPPAIHATKTRRREVSEGMEGGGGILEYKKSWNKRTKETW